MKVIVLLFAILVASVCNVNGHFWDKSFKKCLAENGVNPDDSNNAKDSAEPDHNTKCAYACMLKEGKLTNKNGTVSPHRVDLLMAILKHQVAEIKECFSNFSSDKDKCDESYELHECLRKSGLILHVRKEKKEEHAEKDVENE